MSAIDPNATLADLVVERPGRAALFEQLHLDYCCGGSQTLSEACAARGLDPGTVGTVLEAFEDGNGAAAHSANGGAPDGHEAEEPDWRQASLAELCAHIVAVHHARLRSELPRVGELMATTARVHGPTEPALVELAQAFEAMRAHLEVHIDSEEETLFPRCVGLEHSGIAVDDALLEAHMDEHRDVGERLVALRELGEGYDTRRARCGTHRALLEGLAELERDLHQHVHEENNILMPRARELNVAAHR